MPCRRILAVTAEGHEVSPESAEFAVEIAVLVSPGYSSLNCARLSEQLRHPHGGEAGAHALCR